MIHEKYRTMYTIHQDDSKNEDLLDLIKKDAIINAKENAPGFDFYSQTVILNADDFVFNKISVVVEFRKYL